MNKNIENFIESLLFASGRPLRLSEIRSILENEGIKADLAENGEEAVNKVKSCLLYTSPSPRD